MSSVNGIQLTPPVSAEVQSASQANSTVPGSQSKRKKKARTSKKHKMPNFRKPQTFVTVVVGKDPDMSSFIVHKELLFHHSPFFAHAFSGDFVEARTKTMKMDDVTTEVFGLLVHWLYTKKIELEDEEDEESIKKEDNPVRQAIVLADLWTLADVAQVSILQNEVMKMLFGVIEVADAGLLGKIAIHVYESTVGVTQLKTALIDRVAHGFGEQELFEYIKGGEMPEGMLVDVVMALKKCAKNDKDITLDDYLV